MSTLVDIDAGLGDVSLDGGHGGRADLRADRSRPRCVLHTPEDDDAYSRGYFRGHRRNGIDRRGCYKRPSPPFWCAPLRPQLFQHCLPLPVRSANLRCGSNLTPARAPNRRAEPARLSTQPCPARQCFSLRSASLKYPFLRDLQAADFRPQKTRACRAVSSGGLKVAISPSMTSKPVWSLRTQGA